ncbi:TonB-dependent receptor [Lysobacteraceae bacterium NML93-0792]|nr:TonB-dependent receptor [Xanthomonadaceae bacterium NML93-0792]PBS15158.1 TonB-dependent receptor [Xanthomonadaceae bacterium NML93-0793]PBS17922.1 TonB-dependent receptor [Xanthomonadaceae bacterium NML93-0831]
MTFAHTPTLPRRAAAPRRTRLARSGMCLAIGAALAMPAFAQDAPDGAPATEADGQRRTAELDAITVRGEYIPEPMATTAAVSSFVTREDFERTGDSDAAAALTRVSGLSVVGEKYVYVRGLGERYSSALFNGSPLPSPEPLQRVVPLDLFPAEALNGVTVQKTYSVRYPGEFGGGVIDLQGLTVPDAPFFRLSAGFGGNSVTTRSPGLTHYGSNRDWTGYDTGRRDLPDEIIYSRQPVTSAHYSREWLAAFGSALNNPNLYLLQEKRRIDPDLKLGASGGTAFDVGDDLRLGVIGVVSFDNDWRTRTGKQQDGVFTGTGADVYNDYDFATTRMNARVNGLFGLGLESENHSVAWNTLYVHDTVKESRSRAGYNFNVGVDIREDGTLWLERQLINNQLAGKSSFGEYGDLRLGWRLGYSKARRTTPYETSVRYAKVDGTWVHGSANNALRFGAVDDEVASGGLDLDWRLPTGRELTLSAGVSYSDNDRAAVLRTFRFETPGGALPTFNQYQRVDYLFSDYNFQNGLLTLNEITPNNNGESAYDGTLTNKAAYLQLEGEIAPAWRATVGLRYEDATQAVHPLDIFSGERVGGIFAAEPLRNDYLLPAATITWNFADNQQLRFGASKTIARPQFRELAPQQYTDPDNDRLFFGNPFLVDSELTNFDLRYEWFFDAGEYFTAGLFHKTIDKPVEAVVGDFGGNQLFQGFLNAPEATLYGVELEFRKYFDPELRWLDGGRLYVATNYTWSSSEVNAAESDTVIPPGFNGVPQAARSFVADGSRMQGQSEHIANLQFGIENEAAELQATLIANYVSERISVRGRGGQPDYMEDPGATLDFVLRKGLSQAGWGWDRFKPSLSLSARNILNRSHEEYQERDGARIDLYTYKPGISWDVSLTLAF